jgi:hypothetical protein
MGRIELSFTAERLSVYGSTALCWTLAASSVSWTFTQSVGLLGRGISLSQGRYLHTELHKYRRNEHKHQCLKWDSNPRSQCLSGRRQLFMRPLWSALQQSAHALIYVTYNWIFDYLRDYLKLYIFMQDILFSVWNMMQDFNVFLPAYPKPWKSTFNTVHVRVNSIVIPSNLKFTFALIEIILVRHTS